MNQKVHLHVPGEALEGASPSWVPQRIRPGLVRLRDSLLYARHTQSDLWQFAIEIDELRVLGLGANDLRWLVAAELVERAVETTRVRERRRRFRRHAGVALPERLCFVLSASGMEFVERLSGDLNDSPSQAPVRTTRIDVPGHENSESAALRPHWDSERHEFRLGQTLIKRYRVPSPSQESVLSAFHLADWPPRILNPLVETAEQVAKQRLHHTVRALNRNQRVALVRFRGDGSGRGVLWELAKTGERRHRPRRKQRRSGANGYA